MSRISRHPSAQQHFLRHACHVRDRGHDYGHALVAEHTRVGQRLAVLRGLSPGCPWQGFHLSEVSCGEIDVRRVQIEAIY